MGATGYTSQPFYAPASRTGTLLLEPDGHSITVLGEAWAKLRYEDHVLTGYRQQVDLGYVNPYDGRMAPNTFEGAMLNGKFGWLDYAAGYLTQMKPRDADEFISMSEAAGADRTNEERGPGRRPAGAVAVALGRGEHGVHGEYVQYRLRRDAVHARARQRRLADPPEPSTPTSEASARRSSAASRRGRSARGSRLTPTAPRSRPRSIARVPATISRRPMAAGPDT